MFNYREKLLKALKDDAPHLETIKILYELLMEEVTQNDLSSMWSPFGFIITCLNPPTSSDIVRLHIWLSSMRPKQVPDWPIHFHSWKLKSRVLCGSITNHIYNVRANLNCVREAAALQHRMAAQPRPVHRELYQAKYIGNNSSSVESTGVRVSCDLLNSQTYYPGQSYFVPPEDYHSIDAGENMFCATLVLMSDNNNKIPYIVGQVNHNEKYLYERVMLDARETQTAINELISKLSHMYF